MVNDFISDDIEIIQSFISESVDLLDEVEPNIIELQNIFEDEGAIDSELINMIFRLFHTLKGSAGFLELVNMEKVTHQAENILDMIRKKEIKLRPSLIDQVLKTCDFIRKLLKQVESVGNDLGHEEEADLIVNSLKNLLNNEDESTYSDSESIKVDTEPEKKLSETDNFRLYVDKLDKLFDTFVDQESINENIGEALKLLSEFIKKVEGYEDIAFVLNKILSYFEGVQNKTIIHSMENITFVVKILDVIKDSIENIEKGEKKYMKGAQGIVAFLDSLIEEATPLEKKEQKKEEPKDSEKAEKVQNDTEINNQDFLEAFLQEGDELIDNLENLLLQQMKQIDDMTISQEIFRIFHTLKGNCGIVELYKLESMIHKIETFFDLVRQGKLDLDTDSIQVVLETLDNIRESFDSLRKGEEDYFKDNYTNINYLDNLIQTAKENKIVQKGKTETDGIKSEKKLTEELPPKPESKEIINELKVSDKAVREKKDEEEKPQPVPVAEKKTQQIQAKAERNPIAMQAKFLQKSSIKVDLEKVDKLVNWVGELAIAESMVIQNKHLKDIDDSDFENAVHNLHRIISEIQYVSLSLRMVSIEPTFKKMMRLVNDLSRKANKRINLQIRGESTEIDKSVVELIGDPLVHILRNSVDHGIEPIDERKSTGKNETGNILLKAFHDAGEVHIMIKDDGRGLNHEKIREKAISRGMINENDQLTEQEINKLIFEPGFSTAEKITEVSGRGVGMDVVRKNLEKVKGTIDVESKPGLGTTIKLRIPLTMAIMDGMLVEVGQNSYTIPLFAIREFFRPEINQITITPDEQEVVKVRDELIPIIRLYTIFNIEPSSIKIEEGILIIVEDNNEFFCLLVDNILGQQQAVIKSLPEYLEHIQGISGCTILGNGEVSPIIDISGVVTKIKNS